MILKMKVKVIYSKKSFQIKTIQDKKNPNFKVKHCVQSPAKHYLLIIIILNQAYTNYLQFLLCNHYCYNNNYSNFLCFPNWTITIDYYCMQMSNFISTLVKNYWLTEHLVLSLSRSMGHIDNVKTCFKKHVKNHSSES